MARHDQAPTRRSVLSHAAAGAAVIASGAASAQPAPAAREKGPLVWLDMDQKALDDAYDQAVYAPNAPQLHKRRQDKSKERAGTPRRAPARRLRPDSGRDARHLHDQEAERADQRVYSRRRLAGRRGMGVSATPRSCSCMPARISSCPTSSTSIDAGGSLMPMAEQVRRAVAWVHKNAASFGGDPNRIYVSGRSSGAHLAGTTADHRLEGLRRARRRHQGRTAVVGHVRPQAGAAVEARRAM